jgi:hypothetical protein
MSLSNFTESTADITNQYSKVESKKSTTGNIADFYTKTGRIHQEIGTGRAAQESIVWKSIHFSFWIGIALSSAVIVFFIVTYITKDHPNISFPIGYIKDVWAIFLPIITLALGYIFGKGGE